MGKKSDLESVHLVNHSKCMLAAFHNFRQDETMLDVTLVCNGMSLKAHKLVLSACSPLFKDIFSENPCTHPIIILREFEFSDLKAVIDFIYKGELSVPRERLMSALKVAEELQIRGLKRSEPNREKYEKLYHKVCGKLTSRKKRKRHRQDSSDSEKESVCISDSDQKDVETDESDEAATLEPEQMEVEPTTVDDNPVSDKDIRPVVLTFTDFATTNGEQVTEKSPEGEEKIFEKCLEEDRSHNENGTAQELTENQTMELASESTATNLQFDSSTACPENSDVSLECISPDKHSNFQEEKNMKLVPETECAEKIDLISSTNPSSKSPEVESSSEEKLQDEGKRFSCSKCDKTFTSRINFMRHKTLGHNNAEQKSTYKCSLCNFTTHGLDTLNNHLLIHSDKVPYKCSTCPEEFTSEELFKKHLSVHEVEKIALHSLSSAPGQDLFSTQSTSPEKITEFRCSICFIKFTSKLRCQIHEKSCQGGS